MIKIRLQTLCAMTIVILTTAAAQNANASSSTNWNHEIQVYSIESYAGVQDYISKTVHPWKTNVPTTNARDPYNDFWSAMYTNCSGNSECAHSSSMRRRNSEVTVNSMSNNGEDDFEDADMVFFWGHVAHIPGNPYDFDVWRPIQWSNYVFGWTQQTIPYDSWGTSIWTPYYYSWPEKITDASATNPSAVFYGWYPMTSILMGDDYTDGSWLTNNTYNGWPVTRSGKLGGDLKWFIAHGCSGVPVAVPTQIGGTNVVGQTKGVNIWKKVWDRLHLVLGHYYKSTTATVPNLNYFASDIKNNVPIQQAYFDAHKSMVTDGHAFSQPASITAASRDDCCAEYAGPGTGTWTCNPSCLMKYMTTETWNNVLSNPTGDLIYTSAWNVDI